MLTTKILLYCCLLMYVIINVFSYMLRACQYSLIYLYNYHLLCKKNCLNSNYLQGLSTYQKYTIMHKDNQLSMYKIIVPYVYNIRILHKEQDCIACHLETSTMGISNLKNVSQRRNEMNFVTLVQAKNFEKSFQLSENAFICLSFAVIYEHIIQLLGKQ